MSDIKVKQQREHIPQEQFDYEKLNPKSEGADQETSLTVEERLYESLQRKRILFKVLELEGIMPKPEAETISKSIEVALMDLEQIINSTS